MKARKRGKIILTSILLLMMYASSIGESIGNENENVYLYGFLTLAVVSIIMMSIPTICLIAKGGKLEYQNGKKVCIWNSVIMFIISAILTATNKIGFVGGLGALFYYFINMFIFVKDKDEIEVEEEEEEEIEEEKLFKCENCGELVKESDTICPNCGETFEEEVVEETPKKEKNDMDKKYDDLKKLKKLLDSDIITKKEFEQEKKKILNN